MDLFAIPVHVVVQPPLLFFLLFLISDLAGQLSLTVLQLITAQGSTVREREREREREIDFSLSLSVSLSASLSQSVCLFPISFAPPMTCS